jgi:hypothetical protein
MPLSTTKNINKQRVENYMKQNLPILKTILTAVIFACLAGTIKAQTVTDVTVKPNLQTIQISIDLPLSKIKDVNVISLSGGTSIPLGAVREAITGVFEVETVTPLTVTKFKDANNVEKAKLNPYILNLKIENSKKEIEWQTKRIELPDIEVVANTLVKNEVKEIKDADVYIDGEMRGVRKKRVIFSTNIKLQKLTTKGDWTYTPYGFFKLSASSDPKADPDSMNFGFNFGYTINNHLFWDNEVKIESERDFENSNLIYSTRGVFTPAGVALTEKSDGTPTSVIFFRPYIGAEIGKNLLSPVSAADGDGIARVLAGADLRINVPINDEKGQAVNWTTSYTRRWLLTDELGYEADDDGTLQLTRFGKSPRDYFKSKADFSFNKLFGAFVEYDWGQVPPSYKLVDHKFRVGFFYKFKFGIK